MPWTDTASADYSDPASPGSSLPSDSPTDAAPEPPTSSGRHVLPHAGPTVDQPSSPAATAADERESSDSTGTKSKKVNGTEKQAEAKAGKKRKEKERKKPGAAPKPELGRVVRWLRNSRPALRELRKDLKVVGKTRQDQQEWLPDLLGRLWRRIAWTLRGLASIPFLTAVSSQMATSDDPISTGSLVALAMHWPTWLFILVVLNGLSNIATLIRRQAGRT